MPFIQALWFIIFLASPIFGNETSKPYQIQVHSKYGQRFSDFVVDQRLCTAANVGFDYISSSLSTILDRYIKFYNNPQIYGYKT